MQGYATVTPFPVFRFRSTCEIHVKTVVKSKVYYMVPDNSTAASLPGLVQETMLSSYLITFTHSIKYKRNIVQLLSISYMLNKYKKGENK